MFFTGFFNQMQVAQGQARSAALLMVLQAAICKLHKEGHINHGFFVLYVLLELLCIQSTIIFYHSIK